MGTRVRYEHSDETERTPLSGLMRLPPLAGALLTPWREPIDVRKPARQLTRRLRSIGGTLGETLQDQVVERRRNRQFRVVGWWRRLVVCVLYEDGHWRVTREHRPPREKKIRNAASGVDIRTAVDIRFA